MTNQTQTTWRNFTRHLKVNSRLSHLLQIVKCLQIFQGLNPKDCIEVKERKKKEEESRCLVFRPSGNSANSRRISRAATAEKGTNLLNLSLFWGRREGFQIWYLEKRIFTSIERELHVSTPSVMIWLSACTHSSSFRWNTACKNSSPFSWYLYSWYLCPWGKSIKTVFGLYFLPLFSCISSVWIAFRPCPSRAGNWIQLILRTIFTGFAEILFNGMRILLEGQNGGKIWIEVDFVP